jgi:hypothetical protein
MAALQVAKYVVLKYSTIYEVVDSLQSGAGCVTKSQWDKLEPNAYV